MNNSVDEVQAMQLMGTNVMVGIHADGEEELAMWNSEPTRPSTAADIDPRTWGRCLMEPGCPHCGACDFDGWTDRHGNKVILCEQCGWSTTS